MAGIPFSEVGVEWFEAIVRLLTRWFVEPLESGLENLSELVFSTPLPESGTGVERVFGVPPASDEPWHTIHEAVVAGEVMVFALLVLFLCVQGRQVVRIFNVGTVYQQRRTERSAWVGAVLIVGWYWLGVLVLYFVQGLTVGLLPDVSGLGPALLELLPAALGNPLLTLLLTLTGGIAMLLLEALFFVRQILLYGYLYLMPVGLALAFGNLPIISRVARRLCQQFVPLAILPLPAAVLFRTYDLLFGSAVLEPPTPFLAFVVVVSLPVLALYLTWKTFRYASPLTARLLGGTARTVVTAGAVTAAGTIAGPRLATTAAKWGPRAAARQAVARHAFSDTAAAERRPTGTGTGSGTGATRGTHPETDDRATQSTQAPSSDEHGTADGHASDEHAEPPPPEATRAAHEDRAGDSPTAEPQLPAADYEIMSGAELLEGDDDPTGRTSSGGSGSGLSTGRDRGAHTEPASEPPDSARVRRTEHDPPDRQRRTDPPTEDEPAGGESGATPAPDADRGDEPRPQGNTAPTDEHAGERGQADATDGTERPTGRDEATSETDDDR